MRPQLLCAVLCAAIPGVGAADEFDFSPYVSFPIGSWPEAVAIGDVNGDRLDDMVVITSSYFDENNDKRIFVRLQDPDGTLSEPFKHLYGTSDVRQVALGDIDNDGAAEILVGQPTGLVISRWNGSDGFQTRNIPFQQGNGNVVATQDVNGDGHLDVISFDLYGSTVLLGNGVGEFTLSPGPSGNGLQDIKIGDVSGDGRPDIVAAGTTFDFYVYRNIGGGNFDDAVAYRPPNAISVTNSIAIGDFDNDGKNEVAVPSWGRRADGDSEYGLYVYAQTEAGALDESPAKTPIVGVPTSVLAYDIDGDGRQDILDARGTANLVGRFMRGASGFGAEIFAEAPFDSHNPAALAAGDVDDDGCGDVATVSPAGGLVLLYGENCIRNRTPDDFNADGVADLLWHNNGTGESEIWLSADSAAIRAVTRVNSTDWRIVATGDFNGDDRADIVWHNQLTGAGTIWKSGNYATQQGLTRITDPAWAIAGTGDYDGDGNDDLLWRHATSGKNAIWKSGNYRTQQAITAVTDVLWQAAGSGDFDGDGRDDILWRHATSGRNAIWRGGDYRHQQAVTAITNVEWNVEAVGDFDGDGLDDLFWRHANGANSIWRAAAYTRQLAVPKQATRWALGASADYDGNGKDDLVWRNSVNGNNLIWRAAASNVVRDATTVSDQAWIIHKN